jgi:hypothetical protein
MWHQFGCTADKNRVFDRKTGARELMTPLPTVRYLPISPNLALDSRFWGKAIRPDHIALVEFLGRKLPIACARNGKRVLRAAGSFECASGRENRWPNDQNTTMTHGVLNGSDTLALKGDQAPQNNFSPEETAAGTANRPPRFAATGANRGS